MMNEKNEKVKHCTHCQRKKKWISFVPFNYKENQARQKKTCFFLPRNRYAPTNINLFR